MKIKIYAQTSKTIRSLYAYTALGIAMLFNYNAHAQEVQVDGAVVISVPSGTFMGTGGSITLNGTAAIDNSGTVELKGNWNNNANGLINGSIGTVVLDGDAQSVAGTNPTTFSSLTLLGTGVKSLTLAATVTGTLALNNLELATGTNTLTISATGLITRTTGYISSLPSGFLARNTNSTSVYSFPVGNPGGSLFRPLEITPATSSSNTYKVRLVAGNPTADGFNTGSTDGMLCSANTNFYHRVTQTSAQQAILTMYFSSGLDGNFARVAHWQGTPVWTNMNPVTIVAGAYNLTNGLSSTSWSDFSTEAFALAFAPTPNAPVATSSSSPACTSFTANWTPATDANHLSTDIIKYFLDVSTDPSANTAFVSGYSDLDVGNVTSLNVTGLATGTSYYYRVRAKDDCGTSVSSNVIGPVTTSTSSSPPTSAVTSINPICPGQPLTLTASGGTLGAAAVVNWYSGSCGGTFVGSGNPLSINAPGSSTTYFALYQGTCNTTTCSSVLLNVNTLSTDPSSITSTPSIKCPGVPVTLSVNGGSLGTGANWVWYAGSCGGTPIGTGPSISVNPSSPTTYFVRAEGTCNTTNCASLLITIGSQSTDPSGVSGGTSIFACAGTNVTLTVQGGSLGTGATWKWYAGGCGSGASIGTGTSITVSPSSSTTYFVRAEGTCNTTNCASATITVNTAGTPGNNIWNVYCYNAGDNAGGSNAWNAANYRGFYTENNLNFDTRNRWAIGSNPGAANGTGGNAYTGCSFSSNDNFSYRYIRQGFTPAIYYISAQWDDYYNLFVDGVLQATGTCCGNSATPIWFGSLGASSTVEIRFSEGGGGALGAASFCTMTLPNNDPSLNAFGTYPTWDSYVFDGQSVAPSNFVGSFTTASGSGNTLLNENYGSGQPTTTSGACRTMDNDDYTVRYKSNINFSSGLYVFTGTNDDGRRLYLDGGSSPVFDAFTSTSGTTVSNPVALNGTSAVVYDLYENGGGASANLSQCQMTIPGNDVTLNTAGTGAWNLYYYNNLDFNYSVSTFRGQNTDGSSSSSSASLSENWASGVVPTRAGSTCGTTLNSDFSLRALLSRAFNKGIYSVQSGADDFSRLFINGTLFNDLSSGACCTTATTNVAFDGTTKNIEFQMHDDGGAGTATVNISCAGAVAGTLSSNQTCGSGGTVTLTLSGATGYYQLQSSTDGNTWTGVGTEGNTATTPTPAFSVGTSSTLFYRVLLTSCSGSVASNIVTVTGTGPVTGNLTVSSDITIGGTINVSGNFTLNSGVTITVSRGCPLVINATNITINGTINGNGSGYSGGSGGSGGNAFANCGNENDEQSTGGKGFAGNAGSGPGAGGGGGDGGDANGRARDCNSLGVNNDDGHFGGGGGGGSAGGGAYGSNGGSGAFGAFGGYFNNGNNPSQASFGPGGSGGSSNGTSSGVSDLDMGSGGSGGGGGGGGKNSGQSGLAGGDGGGSISLIASTNLIVSGTITANGTGGGKGGDGSTGSDNVYGCSKGNCGSCSVFAGSTYVADAGGGGGGGGGSGGGIKLQAFGNTIITGSLSAAGGGGGNAGHPYTSEASCDDWANGGGGGGGGRIKIITNPCGANNISPSVNVNGGSGGLAGNGGSGSSAGAGTYVNNIIHPSFVPLTASVTTDPDQTLCFGDNASNLTSSPAASGGIGVYTYQWYQSTTTSAGTTGSGTTPASGWSAISGATSATLPSATIGILPVTTYFQLRLSSGTCNTWSDVTVIRVDETAPVISCPASVSTVSDPSACGATVNYIAPVGTDNCPGAITTLITGKASGSVFLPGITTNTYKVTDTKGNSTTCSFTVTVTDNSPPTFTCPTSVTSNTDVGKSYATINLATPVASDNCGILSVTNDHPDNKFPIGTVMVRWTVTDVNGNTATCNQTVIVNDNEQPFIICDGPVTVNNDQGDCGANVTLGMAYSQDNSGKVVVTVDYAGIPNPVYTNDHIFFANPPYPHATLVAHFPVGVTTLVWTATDSTGNTTFCTQDITVIDNEKPAIACPDPIEVSNDAGICGAAVSYTQPAGKDNCPGAVIMQTAGLTIGALFPIGTTTNIFRITDHSGNISTCSFTVKVNDAELPVFTSCPSNTSRNADDGVCTYTASGIEFNAPATDNCTVSGLLYTLSGATTASGSNSVSGIQFENGTTTVNWTATDPSGNVAICNFTVTVIDNQPPVFGSCPSNITANTVAGGCFAQVSYTTPAGTDNCSGVSTARTEGLASGDNFPLGTTTVTYVVTAANAATASCSFTVTVVDNQAPQITCPGNKQAGNDEGECSAVVTYSAPIASDNCSGATVSQTAGHPSGFAFPVGQTTNIYKVTAANGQTSTCSFKVTVFDFEAPSITCDEDTYVNNDEGSCGAYVVLNAPVVSDNCSVDLSDPSSLTNDAPGDGVYQLGENYVTWTVTDVNGNTNSCTQLIYVTDVEPPSVTCAADQLTELADQGECYGTVTVTGPEYGDNCFNAYIYNDHNFGEDASDTFAVGTTVITWYVSDDAGNENSCTQTITVTDDQLPAVTCPADIMHTSDATVCGYTIVNMQIATATDNCAVDHIDGVRSDALALSDSYPVGITEISWSATDIHGNTSVACIQTIIVTDDEAPVINCPADVTIHCLDASDVSATGDATATDNCGTVNIAHTDESDQDPDPNNHGHYQYTITRTFTATDAAGNSSTCVQTIFHDGTGPSLVARDFTGYLDNTGTLIVYPSDINNGSNDPCGPLTFMISHGQPSAYLTFTCSDVGTPQNVRLVAINNVNDTFYIPAVVTVLDSLSPVITCPENIAVLNNQGTCGAVVDYNINTSDNCSGQTVQQTAGLESGDAFPVGTTTNDFTVTDAHGLTSNCSFTITVNDVEHPAITCATDQIQTADAGVCNATVNVVSPYFSDNCPGSVIKNDYNGGSNASDTYSVGTTSVLWTVTDASGNTSLCTQSITVTDDEKPSITCAADQTQTADAGLCTAAVTVIVPASGDNCGVANVVNNYNNSSDASAIYSVGTAVIVWTVTDINGNTRSCTQSITVTDDEKPSITCSADVSVNNDGGQCSAQITLITPATSDNCAVGSVTNDHPSNTYPVGITDVVWTVQDIHGNTNKCNQRVTVTDNEKPTIACSADVNVNNDGGQCSAQVTLTTPATGDNCAVASITNNYASTTYAVGTTTVVWTVTDIHGNTNSCTQVVTVTDNEVPQIACSANVTVTTDSSRAFATVTLRDPVVSDNCAVSTVVNNHPSSRYPIGTTVVTWTVTDIHGNTASCQQTVIVNDEEAPRILCGTAITVNNDPGRCDANVIIHIPYASDNSGHVSLTVNDSDIVVPPFTPTPITENDPNARPTVAAVFPVGVTILTWTATDSAGNSSSCTQAITVIDNENPSITCSADVNVNNDGGQCSAQITLITPATSDNCGVQSVTNDHPSNTYPVGQTTVTWTVTDIHGNTNMCTQLVTVTDNEKPQISCSADVSVNNDNTLCTAAITLTPASTSDNCAVAGLTNDHSSNIYPVGTTVVTWTVTDIYGNSSSCVQHVTVTDNEIPTISCPANIAVTTNTGCTATGVNKGTPSTGDNCGVASVANDHNSTTYPLGTTTVLWTVTDIHGNTATCNQTVTVTDNVNPTISCPANIATTTNTGCTATGVNLGTPATADNCSVASVTNNHASTTYPLGTTIVTWTVTDGSGNTAACTQTVTVTDNVKPTISCPANKAVTTNTGCTATGVNLGTPSTADNCSVASVTNNHASTTYPLGTTIVTWTVTDGSGNTATCNQTVTVTDATPPAANCKNVTVALDANGNASITVAQVNNNSTDNCGIASVTATPTTFNCSNTGNNNVTLKVTDNSGNVSTCTAVVTVTGGALYQYVMLATDRVHLHHSNVQSGGIGITTTTGEAEIEEGTTVTAPGTFVQALDIDVNTGGMVTTQIHSVANPPIPTFEVNPFTSNNNIHVTRNQTMTLTDSIYNEIHLEKNATVIFTQPVVNVKHIEAEEFSLIKFTQCTKMRIQEHLHLHRNTQFNPDGLGVTVFVQHDAHIDEGSKVFAVMYAKDDHIQVEGKANNRTTMTGLFIANTIEHGDYTDWNVNTQCGRCSVIPGLFARISDYRDVGCSSETTGYATVSASNGTGPYTYVWNTTPVQTGPTATNLGVGTYTVTVTDALGATTTVNANIQVFSYVILATSSVTLGKSDTVETGSVGVTSTSGKADINHNSSVDNLSSIVIAPVINIDNTSTVENPVYGNAPVTTLAYEGNISYSSNSDLTVADNTTVTLTATDTLRHNITVGNNSTLIFSAAVMNVTNTLALKKNATLIFKQCTKVRIKNDFTTDNDATVNAEDVPVTFYVNDNATFNGGAYVQATVFAPNGTIQTQNAHGNPHGTVDATTMVGKFIADKVVGGDNTYWYENVDCPCSSLNPHMFARVTSKGTTCDGASDGSATVSIVGGGTAPYTYAWNTTPVQTTATASNLPVGTYTVTVTDAVGNTVTESTDVIVFTYVVLASNNVNMGKNDTVYSGSIGATTTSGNVNINHNSSVDNDNSIILAPNINIDNTSTAANPIIGVAPATSLVYEGNITYSSTSDLTVADNATVTLTATDTLRRNITVGVNSTLLFSAGVMNVTGNLVMKKGATLKFTKCTKVRIKGDLNPDDNATINPTGYGVALYVNGNANFGKTANVQATIDAPNGNIQTGNSAAATPSVMKGKFIAKNITGGDYTYWYENTSCQCGIIPGSPLVAREITTPETVIEKAKEPAETPLTFMSIKAYPNPFSQEIRLKIYTMDIQSLIVVKVFDAGGELLEDRADVTYDSGDILIGKTLPAGTYIIQVTQGKNIQVERVVKTK